AGRSPPPLTSSDPTGRRDCTTFPRASSQSGGSSLAPPSPTDHAPQVGRPKGKQTPASDVERTGNTVQQSRDQQLGRLSAAAKRTTVRLVIGSMLRSLTWTLPVPLIFAAGALSWIKIAQPGPAAERWTLWAFFAVCLVPSIGAVVALLRKRPDFWGAQVLDRHHRLAGRISNALAFARN